VHVDLNTHVLSAGFFDSLDQIVSRNRRTGRRVGEEVN
jgi:hypothetical protein